MEAEAAGGGSAKRHESQMPQKIVALAFVQAPCGRYWGLWGKPRSDGRRDEAHFDPLDEAVGGIG